MLDIIILIFLARNIGQLAEKKGFKPGPWRLYTVLAWFGGEILGVVIGLMLFGEQIGAVVLLALACAVSSYFILRANLSNRPDMMDDDINRIGLRDLYP